MRKPRPFILCFDSHRPDGLVWTIKQGGRWSMAREITVLVPMRTVYRGSLARQPKAFLVGEGVVSRKGDALIVTA